MAPWGGAGRRLGTNPHAIAVPGPNGAVSMSHDFATSVWAEGKLRVKFNRGEAAPPGIMLARWRAQDLRLTQDTMSFVLGEAKRIRAQVTARKPGSKITLTEAEASRIYQQAGIEIQWQRNWPSTDLESAAQGRLRFTAEESQRMRDEVLNRSPRPSMVQNQCRFTPGQARMLADQYGLLVIDETPAVSHVFSDPADIIERRRGHLERVLTDLIARDRNHACVIMWSVANEPLTKPFHTLDDAPADSVEKGIAFFRPLFEHVRALDSSHPVMLVSVHGGPDEWLDFSDVTVDCGSVLTPFTPERATVRTVMVFSVPVASSVICHMRT